MKRRWTEEEIKTLKSLYPIKEAEEIARVLNRTVGSIYGMVKILGINKYNNPNEYIIDGDFCKIRLNGKHSDKFAIIDTENIDKVKSYFWYGKPDDRTIYVYGSKNGKIVILHHIISDIKNPDHINKNGLDNRKSNLRQSNQQQNSQNRNKRKNCKSKYIGVTKVKNRWIARINDTNGNRITVGRFSNEDDAGIARDLAAIKYHGEFASLNFPKENYENYRAG